MSESAQPPHSAQPSASRKPEARDPRVQKAIRSMTKDEKEALEHLGRRLSEVRVWVLSASWNPF